ncbi:hypothetical protein M426DRAFT_17989 [Hypoxylon sp. CI-4A]|nr:hypothetical protein M426DRAFT_17989 [Hypoxylon sp. CI-4A]
MATSNKPTLLIISGGFHIPASYAKLSTALESAGYEVHIPRLTSCYQMRPPIGDLTSDSILIRGYVESLVRAGRTVVVIVHSYGGQVGTNALYGLELGKRSRQGLKGGVKTIIYMASYALTEGVAALDKAKEFGNMDLVPLVFDIAEDKSAVPCDARASFVDPSLDDAEASMYLSTLVRSNGRCFFQPLEHAAWREFPSVAYIYTTADMMVPIHYQKNIVEGVEKNGVKVQTFEMNTGHCPCLTDAQGVVDIVNSVVAD